jgi:hypothetical protein
MQNQTNILQEESVEGHFHLSREVLLSKLEEVCPSIEEPQNKNVEISDFGIENLRPIKSIRERFLIIEYKSLREELLKRIELRQHVVQINLTIASLILSYGIIQRVQDINSGQGVATPEVALIYPPIAALLGLGWAQIEDRIQNISAFIRLRIERNIPDLCWETYMDEFRKGDLFTEQSKFTKKGKIHDIELINISDQLGKFSSSILLSHGGVFIMTQIMAIYIGFPWNPVSIFLYLYNVLINPKQLINVIAVINLSDIFFGLLILIDCYCCFFIYNKFRNLEVIRKKMLKSLELDPSIQLKHP